MNIKKTVIQLGISFVLLVMGLLIYLSTRTGTYVNAIFDNIISLPPIEPQGVFKTLLYNWGADFLWASSFALALSCFMDKALWAGFTVFGLGLLFEVFQLLGITTGTFDFFDIVAEFFGVFIPITIILWQNKRNKHST